MVASRNSLEGEHSLYATVLYQADLISIGDAMRQDSSWNPVFEVYETPMKKAWKIPKECGLAPYMKYQLQLGANRPLTVQCWICPSGPLGRCHKAEAVRGQQPKKWCTFGRCRNGPRAWESDDGTTFTGSFSKGAEDLTAEPTTRAAGWQA